MAEAQLPLADQIWCAKRELAMRERVYPKWVADGRMEQAKAAEELAGMRSIIQTLEVLAHKEAMTPKTPQGELHL